MDPNKDPLWRATCYKVPKCRDLASPPARLRIRYITENPSTFKPVSKGAKIRKAAPKASNKKQRCTPKFIKNNFSEQLFFAILSERKPGFRSPKCQVSKFRFKNRYNNKTGNEPDKSIKNSSLKAKTTFQNKVPEINPNVMK